MRLYSVQRDWSLLEHRCESDESRDVWAVVEVERLGAFALVVDDSPATPTPTPTPAAAAIGDAYQLGDRECVNCNCAHVAARTAADTCADCRSHSLCPCPGRAGDRQVLETFPTATPMPTPTAVPQESEPPAPVVQASAGEGGSGGIGRMALAAVGVPMLFGALIALLLLYRERQRRNGYHGQSM